jgi:exodeoxyribonuclease-3
MESRPKKQALKILSWNIRHGGGSRLARIQEIIAAHDPDILILPEFRNNASGEKLRQWLREAEHHHQSAGGTEQPAHNTVLLSSKYEFTPLSFPELGPDRRRCVGGRFDRLTVLGFYFAVMEAKRPAFEFIKRLPKAMLKADTLLMGDFNTGCRYWDEGRMDLSLVEEFGALLGCGWTDVWRQRNPGIREWSWVEPWGRHVGYRLDHALVSPSLLAQVNDVRYSHAERGNGMSDHSGLVLELDTTKKQEPGDA